MLLLEAGSAERLELMTLPPAWPALLQSSANWGESTVEQAATGTSTILARGRGLGGSSAINATMFARGHRSSYDAWVEGGAQGWGFDDLLPYFERSESTEGRDPALRGVNGPLTPGPANAPNPLIVACMEAAAELGYPRATDLSGGLEEGFGWPDLNIVDGKRQSAADAYLTPAVLDRPNLDVVTDALVHRVQIKGDRCTGVRYSTGAQLVAVACSREVVLTAGVRTRRPPLPWCPARPPGGPDRTAAVFDRLPDLALAVAPSELRPVRSLLVNGHTRLPVRPHPVDSRREPGSGTT